MEINKQLAMRPERDAIRKLIDFFGTQQRCAEALGCRQASVTNWLRGRNGMKAKHAILAEKLTDGLLTKEMLCPDSFIDE